MTTRVSPQLERVLDNLLDSYEKVEIVWNLASTPRLEVGELQARARIGSEALDAALAQLAEARVVTIDTVDGVTSAALGPRARMPDVEELIRVRTSDPLSVISTLMSLSIRRVRSMAARAFADAFVVRRKKRDE